MIQVKELKIKEMEKNQVYEIKPVVGFVVEKVLAKKSGGPNWDDYTVVVYSKLTSRIYRFSFFTISCLLLSNRETPSNLLDLISAIENYITTTESDPASKDFTCDKCQLVECECHGSDLMCEECGGFGLRKPIEENRRSDVYHTYNQHYTFSGVINVQARNREEAEAKVEALTRSMLISNLDQYPDMGTLEREDGQDEEQVEEEDLDEDEDE